MWSLDKGILMWCLHLAASVCFVGILAVYCLPVSLLKLTKDKFHYVERLINVFLKLHRRIWKLIKMAECVVDARNLFATMILQKISLALKQPYAFATTCIISHLHTQSNTLVQLFHFSMTKVLLSKLSSNKYWLAAKEPLPLKSYSVLFSWPNMQTTCRSSDAGSWIRQLFTVISRVLTGRLHILLIFADCHHASHLLCCFCILTSGVEFSRPWHSFCNSLYSQNDTDDSC